MHLNSQGQIAHREWARLPTRFETLELNEFAVMPNHIHGIIIMIDIGLYQSHPFYSRDTHLAVQLMRCSL